MDEKTVSRDASMAQEGTPPPYVADEAQSQESLTTDRPFRDRPNEKRPAARSYSSDQVGPSRLTGTAPQPALALFTSWGSKKKARSSLSGLYTDIIQNPSLSTVDIFSTILDTCKKGDLSLESISTLMDRRLPIYWMIVNAKQMPGTIELFLTQKHAKTRPTQDDMNHGKQACLVHDDVDYYRQLTHLQHESASSRGFHIGDQLEVFKTEGHVLGFIVNITFHDFASRYRTSRSVAITFPARHRAWTIRLGLPDILINATRPAGRLGKVAELRLERGDYIPCVARIRLRRPGQEDDSPWLALGKLHAVSDLSREAHLATMHSRSPIAHCTPIELNTSADWRALEFGDDTFLGDAGKLCIQLQITAKDPERTGEACTLQ